MAGQAGSKLPSVVTGANIVKRKNILVKMVTVKKNGFVKSVTWNVQVSQSKLVTRG